MEPLPRGANFQRAKLLWEIGLHIAGDPKTPYYGPRDVCISVGSGSAENFKPKLRMSTGSPILAHAVCRGDLEMSMVNPSGFLTQAYRGTGLFPQPLPVRVLANYPSWDRYVHVIHPRTGLKSLAELKAKKYPLRLSIREDATHSTRVLLDQTLARFLLRTRVSFRAQPFDQSRHLAESGAELGLSFVDLVGRGPRFDGVLVGCHGNAKRPQYPACFVAWHDFTPSAGGLKAPAPAVFSLEQSRSQSILWLGSSPRSSP